MLDLQLSPGNKYISKGRFHGKAPLCMDPEAREQNGFGESVSPESVFPRSYVRSHARFITCKVVFLVTFNVDAFI